MRYRLVKCMAGLAMLISSVAFGQSNVEEFVNRKYLHEVPYNEARALGRQAVPVLIRLMNDPTRESSLPNVVITLGYLGMPEAVAPFEKLMEETSGPIKVERFRALLRIFQGMGYIAANGDSKALSFLLDYARIDRGPQRRYPFTFPGYNQEKFDDVYARMAIAGLGLSGNKEALKRLRELKSDRSLPQSWIDNVEEAEALNLKAGRFGIDNVIKGNTK